MAGKGVITNAEMRKTLKKLGLKPSDFLKIKSSGISGTDDKDKLQQILKGV